MNCKHHTESGSHQSNLPRIHCRCKYFLSQRSSQQDLQNDAAFSGRNFNIKPKFPTKQVPMRRIDKFFETY